MKFFFFFDFAFPATLLKKLKPVACCFEFVAYVCQPQACILFVIFEKYVYKTLWNAYVSYGLYPFVSWYVSKILKNLRKFSFHAWTLKCLPTKLYLKQSFLLLWPYEVWVQNWIRTVIKIVSLPHITNLQLLH